MFQKFIWSGICILSVSVFKFFDVFVINGVDDEIFQSSNCVAVQVVAVLLFLEEPYYFLG